MAHPLQCSKVMRRANIAGATKMDHTMQLSDPWRDLWLRRHAYAIARRAMVQRPALDTIRAVSAAAGRWRACLDRLRLSAPAVLPAIVANIVRRGRGPTWAAGAGTGRGWADDDDQRLERGSLPRR